MARYAPRFAVCAAALGMSAIAACGGEPGSTPGEKGTPVAITVTGAGCQVAATKLPEGSITFTVTNQSGSTAEVGVYSGGKPLAEQRGIGAGAVTDLVATLRSGSYEIACRTGSGAESRQPITVG